MGTGPLEFENDTKNLAVKRAWENLQDMEKCGFLKHGLTGNPVEIKNQANEEKRNSVEEFHKNDKRSTKKLRYLDGGLVNMFPDIDESTVVVSPVSGKFSNPFIAPCSSIGAVNFPDVKISNTVQIGVNAQNLVALYQMARSSSPEVLDDKFRDGYDDAKRFLNDNNLLNVFSA